MRQELKFHSIDSGFARVYFRNYPLIYCLQEINKNKLALYRCSRDGEPSYELSPKNFDFTLPRKYDDQDNLMKLVVNFVNDNRRD